MHLYFHHHLVTSSYNIFFILITRNYSQFNKTLKNVPNLKHISTTYSVILLTCMRPRQALNYLVELGHSSYCYFPGCFFFFAFPFSRDGALHVQIPLSGIHEASSLSLMQICNRTQVASIQT